MQIYSRSAIPTAEHNFAKASQAMVTSSHPFATEAALDMLRRGGSAADAYVAAAAVQVVVEPTMTTFSGGLGMTWFDGKIGKTTSIGGTFGCPEAENGDWDEEGADGGRTIAVPGWLNGARVAWQTFGKLQWAELFEHALQHAKEGFIIDPHLWGWVCEYRYKMARFPEGQKLWYPEGYLLNPGDRLVQTDLAHTIEQIQADESLEWFYKGEFAEHYVARAQADGGRITLSDMAKHCGNGTVMEAAPLGGYRGYEIHSPGASSILLALQVAEYGDLKSAGCPVDNPETLYRQMRLIEEIWHEGLKEKQLDVAELYTKFSYEDNLDTTKKTQELWQRVVTQPTRPYDPLHPGTNALVITDIEGNVAFGTHSCSCHAFGNGHIVDGVWISRPIMIYGQPTPLPAGITTSLLLAKEGKPHLVVGSPSISCLNNILQNTLNVIEFGMSLEESVQQPMFGAPWYPSQRAMIEGNFPEAAYEHLTKRGMGFKRVSPNECEMGSCHAIRIDHDKDVIYGVADPRRRGMAAGL